MKYYRIDGEDQTILQVAGGLDAMTAPELMPAIDAIVEDGRREVVVDLSELDLIDSSGVAAIVALYKRVRARGGHVKVAGARDQPLSIFRLLRMDRVFSMRA
jgi:anti-sigma B factor antagonist